MTLAADSCKGHIGGTRVTCLTCRLEGTFDTVDFCENSSCMSAKVIPTGLTVRYNGYLARVPTDSNARDCTSLHMISSKSGAMYILGREADAFFILSMLIIWIRQFGTTYRQAQHALKRSREFFPDPDADKETDVDDSEHPTLEAPRCAVCRRAVTQPCWFCVQCEGVS